MSDRPGEGYDDVRMLQAENEADGDLESWDTLSDVTDDTHQQWTFNIIW